MRWNLHEQFLKRQQYAQKGIQYPNPDPDPATYGGLVSKEQDDVWGVMDPFSTA